MKINQWSQFNANTNGKPPKELYTKALNYIAAENVEALDIAAGPCNETKDMLRRGFRVTAFDSNSDIETIAKNIKSDLLSVSVSTMEDYSYGNARFDFIIAMFALPFIPSEKFEATFKKITNSLKPGGVVAFHLFGDRDGWSKNEKMTFFDESKSRKLIQNLEKLLFKEIEYDGKTAAGADKHWHIFQIVVRKYL